ncbi:mucin-5AC-like isoform X2 [Brienomyrus brachyistius]|uniref:mucin-5AC-like isoform X2 n=1 Tax=Brienomyrus brachyistius TaxID=42636 RepID=UPI0020B441ED|nr:mucin-5AC-like isoform X2 [Brienomyrus brachyistius]
MACADCGILGHNRLLMKVLLFFAVFACHAGTVVETSFLGGLKAVFSGGCDDRWTLLTQRRLPLEAQLSMCVHIRVLSQDEWVAFTYNTPRRKQPELGLQGDKEGLSVWLRGKKLHFPVHLVPQAWHHVCVAQNARNKSLVLQVDTMRYWRKVYTSSTHTHVGQLVLGCGDISGQVAPIELYMFRMWDNASYHSDCKDGNLVAWTSELWNQHGRRTVPDATLPCGHLRVKRAGSNESTNTAVSSTFSSARTTSTLYQPIPSPISNPSTIISSTSHLTATSPTTLLSARTSQPSATPLTTITLSKVSPTSNSSATSPTTLPSATSPTTFLSSSISSTSNSSATSLTTLPSTSTSHPSATFPTTFLSSAISSTSHSPATSQGTISSSMTSPTSNSSAISLTILSSTSTSHPSATSPTTFLSSAISSTSHSPATSPGTISSSMTSPTSNSSAISLTTLPSTSTSHPSATSPTTFLSSAISSTSHSPATSPGTVSSSVTSPTSNSSANLLATISPSVPSPTSNSSTTSPTSHSSKSTSHPSATSLTANTSSTIPPTSYSPATSPGTLSSSIISPTSNSSATSPTTLSSTSTYHPSATSPTTFLSSAIPSTSHSPATSQGTLSSSVTSPASNSSATSLTTLSSTSTSHPSATSPTTFLSSAIPSTSHSPATSPGTLSSLVTSPTSNSSATSPTTLSSTSTFYPSATSPTTFLSSAISSTSHSPATSQGTLSSSVTSPASNSSATSLTTLSSTSTSHPSATSPGTISSSITSPTSNSSAMSLTILTSTSTSHPSATSPTTFLSSAISSTSHSPATSPGTVSSSVTSPTSNSSANLLATISPSVPSPTSNSSTTSPTSHSYKSTSHPSATSLTANTSSTISPTSYSPATSPVTFQSAMVSNSSGTSPTTLPSSQISANSSTTLLSATSSHPSSTTSPKSIPSTSVSAPFLSFPTTSSNSSRPTTSSPPPTSTKILTTSPTPTTSSLNTTENATLTTHTTTVLDASTSNRSIEFLVNYSTMVPPTTGTTPRTTLLPDANTTLTTKNATTNSTCQCDSYCNAKGAYYSFKITVNNPAVTITTIKNLISTLNLTTPACRMNSSSSSCSSSLTSQDDYVNCNNPDMTPVNCTVVLKLAEDQDVCSVRVAVARLFTGNSSINFTGPVCRVAICGPMVNISSAEVNWYQFNYSYKDFCVVPYVWPCQGGCINVNILNETCDTNSTVPLHTVSTVPYRPPSAVTTVSTPATQRPPVVTTTRQNPEKQPQELLNQTMNAAALNSTQVAALVSSLEELLSGPNISLELGMTVISAVSNLLNASTGALAASSAKIIGLVDTVGIKLVLAHPTEKILSESVALGVKKVDGTDFQMTSFTIMNSSSVQIDANGSLKAATSSPVPQGSITLPASLTSNLTSQDKLLASRVQFNFYQKSTVFVDNSLSHQKLELNSGILGSSVANLSISGLKDRVVFSLKNTKSNDSKRNVSCVFWDFTKNNGSGGWSRDGCFLQNNTNEQTTCSCNHLTSFAVLLDISTDIISPVQNEILTYISYVGCGISAIFLSVTLLTYLAFEKLRRDIPSKILIQLCMALLMLNLVFLLDSWLALYPQATGLCASTAFFLHYFLLASFTWMGLEAFHMYLALVKVFNTYVTRYMLKFCIVGWGAPLVVVVIIISVNQKNYGLGSYGHFPDGSTDTFCWLTDLTVFYVGVVAYFCLVFLINLAMFVVVLVQLCRIKRQNPHNTQHRSLLQDLRSVAGLTVLLGLTWGFAFFAWGPVNLAFMYLFSIFNSLQGFFIFVFHCAIKENVRKQWRTYLCCGSLRLPENSEWSRTATQNLAKNRSRILPGSSHLSNSTQSNNTSSTSFLASEPSDSVNGIENPYDDRHINALEGTQADVIVNEINSKHRTTRRQ